MAPSSALGALQSSVSLCCKVSTANKFTVVGCRTLAYIGDNENPSAMYQTGCVAMCFQGNMALNPCSGMGCCQTAIPRGLQHYNVWFDERLNMSSSVGDGSQGPCSYAVLMDGSSTFSTSNNVTEFNNSRNGQAPVVHDCDTARTKPEYACASSNSVCMNAASGRGYICNCTEGFEGNPYLSDGCTDINERFYRDKYPCRGVCTNTYGSYTCDCPRGTRGNAITGECQKDPFPPGARKAAVACGILFGD